MYSAMICSSLKVVTAVPSSAVAPPSGCEGAVVAARSQPLVGGHGLPQGMSRPMASRASDCMCSLSSGPGERATNRMGRVLARHPWMSSRPEVVSQEGSRSLNVDRAAVLLAQLGCQLPWGTDPHAANGEGSLQEGPISIDETQGALYG